MTAIYEKLGVRFMYPANWEVVDDDPAGDPRTIAVHNQTGAFWSITAYRSGVGADEIASTALAALREEYADLEAEPRSEKIGQVDATGYEVQFYVEPFVAAARIRAFEHDSQMVLLLCQAEDQEFDRLQRVFDAMTLSYVQPPEK